ncbi:MAG: glutamate--cysteine ligase [Cellvibrionaceae bacterium]
MSRLQQHLTAIGAVDGHAGLTGIRRGLEKESLRVTGRGTLALTPHSPVLGSPLTHPEITTDFSEALLEFITAPDSDVATVLGQLENVHRFTYHALRDEYLWVNSMPCVLSKDDNIPVARYGDSNVAKMKTVYRLGLGHRYGRLMQTIAGIHYNFSLPDEFWTFLREAEKSTLDIQSFKTQRYFDLIRNFRRYFWLLLYFFGAAPAICPTFVQGREHSLVPLDKAGATLHAPHATSLRMGDLGYQSKAQQSLHIDYNNLPDYLRALCSAITRPHPDYEAIGVKDAQGHYQQLNTGILQIENEFYSTIRPKRTARSGEAALRALHDRGVEYVEVRCLDLDPYQPLGIGAEQIHFLDTFLVYCLLADSPPADADEHGRVQENQQRIVYRGRDPRLELLNQHTSYSFSEWATELLSGLRDVAGLLDAANGAGTHTDSVNQQADKLREPGLTPSARILSELRENRQSFYEFGLQQAMQHAQYFRGTQLDEKLLAHYRQLASRSLEEQRAVEHQEQLGFAEYLAGFYAQYGCCSSP